MSRDDEYISVSNWSRFQHYDPAKRTPPWIKSYTDLMHDDSYLELSTHRRAVLHGLWLEYASSHARLRVDTRSISRRLNARVTRADLEALRNAGFLRFVASASLADGYHDVSLETEEKRKEKEEKANTFQNSDSQNGRGRGIDEDCDNCKQRPAFDTGSQLLCESCLLKNGVGELITSTAEGGDVDIPF